MDIPLAQSLGSQTESYRQRRQTMSVTVLRLVRYLVLATPLVASTLPGCGDAALRPELQSPWATTPSSYTGGPPMAP